MQVRCPHCTSVFSTDRAGTQLCPRCGAQLHVPEEGGVVEAGLPPEGAELPPGPGGEPSGGGGPTWGAPLPAGDVRGPTPWERRKELGLLRALFETWRESVLGPQRFWPRVRPDAPWTEALLYGWLLAAVTAVASIPLLALQRHLSADDVREAAEQLEELPPRMREALRPFLESAVDTSLTDLVAQALGSALAWPLGFIITAAVLHVCCLLVGASRGGFGVTARVVGYAWGPMVIMYVPFLGWLGWVYAAVQAAWGVKELHQTTWGRAIGAVAIPFVVLCCCTCCLGMAGVGAAFSGAGARP